MSLQEKLQLNNLLEDTMQEIKDKMEAEENPSFKQDLQRAYDALKIVWNRING